jgi:hypothetical protein
MLQLIERVHTPVVVDMSHVEPGPLREVFARHGSDKPFHKYDVLYSEVLDPSKEMSIMEIGLGSRNPNIPSTMYFYEQDKNFINTTGGSLRAFKEYCPLAKIYGADVDEESLFTEDRIETFFVDQLDKASLKSLFDGRMFDVIIDDGLHHVTSNMNTLLAALDHVKVGGHLIIEDVVIPENWHVIDFVVSRIPGLETRLVHFGTGAYLYCVHKKF